MSERSYHGATSRSWFHLQCSLLVYGSSLDVNNISGPLRTSGRWLTPINPDHVGCGLSSNTHCGNSLQTAQWPVFKCFTLRRQFPMLTMTRRVEVLPLIPTEVREEKAEQ